ncbi:restriction endonuclease subunit S [Acinetobacter baumannii]|uniref:restriction endonuclease subunit S n=1 Tax=Acinetobacter baumannii TaxID=470 RepID=UPI003A8B562D|nr:restriction endonuclease subunit S [Acinetobacter baumannii]
MAKYQAYAEYKDSGVEWLGEIPSHWTFTSLKRFSFVKGGYAFSSDIFTSVGKPIIRIGDIQADGSISLENCKNIPLTLAENSQDYLVTKGQILMAMTGATIGKAGIFNSDEVAYLNQRVGKFIIDSDALNYGYLWYLLKTHGYQEYIRLTAFGGAQPNISDTAMVDFNTCIPSLSEQEKIANFLDHETTKIDHLIEKQQQLIELLKEKRQAVISHAVTKGLDPNVPMKDSGVAWLGEVPEHWDIKKIKYLGSILNGYAFPSDGFTEEGIKVLKISNIQTMYLDWTDLSFVNENQAKKLEQFLVKKGDLVFALTRPIISTGIKATLMDLDEKILLNQRNAILRPNGLCIQKWLYYMILNQNFVQEFNNQIDKTGQQPNISTVAIGNLEISVAPIEEQIKIVEFIAEKVERIDDLIKKAESAIQLMQERRTALISAAVTGKIDVRHWQAPNVTEADTELSA